GLKQDQVPGPARAVGEAYVALALGRVEAVDGHDHRLVGLEALEDGGAEELVGAGLELVLANSAGEQRAHLAEGEHGPALLDDALGEAGGLRGGGADDQEQAAGRVAESIGRGGGPGE